MSKNEGRHGLSDITDDMIEKAIGEYGSSHTELLQILLSLQKKSEQSWISKEVAEKIAEKLDIVPTQVFEVVTYFNALSDKPRGKHLIYVCESTVCSIMNNEELLGWIYDLLKIKPGETTEDGMFSLVESQCFGACDIAPAIRIDNAVYGNLSREKLEGILADKTFLNGGLMS